PILHKRGGIGADFHARALCSGSRTAMPEQETIERAKEDEREGKSPTTQAGEFVREEIHHVREGKTGRGRRKQPMATGRPTAGRSSAARSVVETQGPGARRAAARKAARTRARHAA